MAKIKTLEDFSDNTMPNNNSVAPDLNQNPNQQLNQMPLHQREQAFLPLSHLHF